MLIFQSNLGALIASSASAFPPNTAKWLDSYYLCLKCDQLFREGTHVLALRERVAGILAICRPTVDPEGL